MIIATCSDAFNVVGGYGACVGVALHLVLLRQHGAVLIDRVCGRNLRRCDTGSTIVFHEFISVLDQELALVVAGFYIFF